MLPISDEVRQRAEKTLAQRRSEEKYAPKDVPYIFCEWSECDVFQDKTAYSLTEFDRLMSERDNAYVEKQEEGVKMYGSWQDMYDSDDPEYIPYLGREKVRFTLVLPDGRTFTERQDIGDGDGGVVDFLSQFGEYKEIIPLLRESLKALNPLKPSTTLPLLLNRKLPCSPATPLSRPINLAIRSTWMARRLPSQRWACLLEVQLQDPVLAYPILRSEGKENFEKLLRRDDRNLPITDYLPVTRIGPAWASEY